ncbi:hypothetical protein TNCV_3720241 [Trichonephila clavipes]|nr:hypothetical protein TNCV_3720241 [Trichonephila clavipes]
MKRKLDWTGASEMNRLYPNSRRESINENKYLNTLPRRGGGWRKKRPNENETEVRHKGRNGRAQGRGGLTAPKTRSRSTKTHWDEKWMETARQNLQPEQLLKSKQEPPYSLIPFLM